ncbi:MAG: B12-binding domain-containing radical SAM protein [Nitrospirae bacterium YQR-1]
MTTTLIAPTPPDVAAFGVRTLSAYLKKHGKEVRNIFLPGGVEKFKYKTGFKYNYEQRLMDQVVELCRGSDLVGISFMSNYLDRATQLCETLRAALKVPIIVGGIHPTVMPEDCLRFADIVCVGEGEETLLELVNAIETGSDYSDIQNLCLMKNGVTRRNPMRALVQDLDSIPFCDFGMDGHFIYDNIKSSVEPMSKNLLKRMFPLEPHLEGTFYDSYKRTLSFKIMTTRGCPHHCSFCAEKTLSDMYKGQRYLRKRGVNNIIEELLWVKREFDFVESIFLFDDTFMVRPEPEIIEFAEAYKKHIGLPFHIQASPGTVTEGKMEALIDAGLAFVEMGIQSMSELGMALYKRSITGSTILKAADVFHKYQGRIYPPCYHIILDNPWESTSDVVETLNLILELPRPFWLKRASLVCFPGTDLYEKAKRDGIIKTEEDEWREVYSKHLHTPHGSYVNFLTYLAGFSYFPRFIVKILASKFLVGLFDKKSLNGLYSYLNRMGERLIVVSKGIRSLFKGDFNRIYRYFIRTASKTS